MSVTQPSGRQRQVTLARTGGRVVQRQDGRAVVVALDQQSRSVRREPADEVGGVVGDQPLPPARGQVVPGDAGELAVSVGGEDQPVTAGQPAEAVVHGRRVRLGDLGDAGPRRRGQVDQQHVRRPGRDGRIDGQREPAPVRRQPRLMDPPVAKDEGPLGAVGQISDDRIERDAVPPVGQVADLVRRDIGQVVDEVGIAHHRLEVGHCGRAGPGQPQQRQLVPLVAAVVVRHDHRALAGQVAAAARPGQRGERDLGAVWLDLDELDRTRRVAAGQDAALRVHVERPVQRYC